MSTFSNNLVSLIQLFQAPNNSEKNSPKRKFNQARNLLKFLDQLIRIFPFHEQCLFSFRGGLRNLHGIFPNCLLFNEIIFRKKFHLPLLCKSAVLVTGLHVQVMPLVNDFLCSLSSNTSHTTHEWTPTEGLKSQMR